MLQILPILFSAYLVQNFIVVKQACFQDRFKGIIYSLSGACYLKKPYAEKTACEAPYFSSVQPLSSGAADGSFLTTE